VAIADRGPDEAEAERLDVVLQTEVGHDGRHDLAAAELTTRAEHGRSHRQDVVAVADRRLVVDQDATVGIAVKRDPEPGRAALNHLGEV